MFTWTYKDLKGIPLELAHHIIELDTTRPLAHQAMYKLNPNYVIEIKQDTDKLLVAGFI
jgi:predicted transcriptional regulator